MDEAIGCTTVQVLAQHHLRFFEFLERRVGSRAEAEEIPQAAFAVAV